MMAGLPVRFVIALVLLCGGISGVAAETYCFDAAVQDNGLFDDPTDITVDSAGTVYVAGDSFILRFDTAGWLSFIPPIPPLWVPLAFPRGVATDGGRVFVADTGNRSVQVFSPVVMHLGSWVADTVAGPLFLNPVGMGLDPDGRLYVADSGTNSVEVFFLNGTPFLRLESGFGAVNLSLPMDVAVNSPGCIFVANTGPHTFRFFAANGPGFDAGGWGEVGQNNGQFRFPVGTAIDGRDNLFVADRDNHRIQKFTAGGTFDSTWGMVGSSPGRSPGTRRALLWTGTAPSSSQIQATAASNDTGYSYPCPAIAGASRRVPRTSCGTRT